MYHLQKLVQLLFKYSKYSTRAIGNLISNNLINAMNEFLSEMVLAGVGTPVVGPVLFHSTLYMLLLLDSKWRSALAPYSLLTGLDSGVIIVVEMPPY